MDKIKSVYRERAQIAFPVGAKILRYEPSGDYEIQACWSQRDLERKERIAYITTQLSHKGITATTPPVVTDNEQLRRYSPSYKYCAILRNVTPKKDKGEAKQHIEIWDGARKIKNFDTSNFEKQHGKINTDAAFTTFEWSHAEDKLLYVAEKKVKKSKYAFTAENQKDEDSEEKKEEAKDKEEENEIDSFVYKESWGEGIPAVCHPVLCVLDLKTTKVKVITTDQYDISVGQASWNNDDSAILCTGFYNTPYRLGLYYCDNRRSDIFLVNVETSSFELISDNATGSFIPVYTPSCTQVLYLRATNLYGPHKQCDQLVAYDLQTKSTRVVVDSISSSKIDDSFPGLYATSILRQGFTTDGKSVIVNSLWRGNWAVLSIDISSGKVTRLIPDTNHSYHILDMYNDVIAMMVSAFNVQPYLAVYSIPNAQLTPLPHSTSTPGEPLAHMTWRRFTMTPTGSDVNQKYPDVDYECFLLEPAQGEGKPPMIVYNHGGPHSSFTVDYTPYFSCLCELGYAILMVNYRGSIGYGQASVDSLPGLVGTQDVQDIQRAVEYVNNELQLTNRDKCVVIGGSHGGFLTAHLIGQYPDYYKAACCRNPVLNIGTMAGSTDINDWCFCEAGLPYDLTSTVTDEAYQMMYQASPIRYVHQVKTPLMLMIGEDDLRVPPKQAIEYRKALLARGVKVRTLMYPGNSHPLDTVECEADCFVNIAAWFEQHLQ